MSQYFQGGFAKYDDMRDFPKYVTVVTRHILTISSSILLECPTVADLQWVEDDETK